MKRMNETVTDCRQAVWCVMSCSCPQATAHTIAAHAFLVNWIRAQYLTSDERCKEMAHSTKLCVPTILCNNKIQCRMYPVHNFFVSFYFQCKSAFMLIQQFSNLVHNACWCCCCCWLCFKWILFGIRYPFFPYSTFYWHVSWSVARLIITIYTWPYYMS